MTLQLPKPQTQIENYLIARYAEGIRTGLDVGEKADSNGWHPVKLWLSGQGNTPFRTRAKTTEDGNVIFEDVLPELMAA